MSWERRGLEESSGENVRLSASVKSSQQSSGSTTIIPSDGRRDSGHSGDSEEEDGQDHQRSVMSLTPPPLLFSIPESGSSSTFVPARSGTPWGRDHSAEPRRSTSRNSRRSEGPQRSHSRMSQRSEELERSLSRISARSQEVERSLSRMSQRSQEPRKSTSKRSDATVSPEPIEKELPEKPTTQAGETIASEQTTAEVPTVQESNTDLARNPQEPRLSIFRDVSYATKSND